MAATAFDVAAENLASLRTPLRRCRKKTKDPCWTGTPSSSPQAISPPTLLKRRRCSSSNESAGAAAAKRRAAFQLWSESSPLSCSLRVLPPFGWSCLENSPPEGTQQPSIREPRTSAEVLVELLSEARSLADEAAARSHKRRALETVGAVSPAPRAQLNTVGRPRRRAPWAPSPPPQLQGIASMQSPRLETPRVQPIWGRACMSSTESTSAPEHEQRAPPRAAPGEQLGRREDAKTTSQAASSSLPQQAMIPHAPADKLRPHRGQAGPKTAAALEWELELKRTSFAKASPAQRTPATVPPLVLVTEEHTQAASASASASASTAASAQQLCQSMPAITEAKSSSSSVLASASMTPASRMQPEHKGHTRDAPTPSQGLDKLHVSMTGTESTSSTLSPQADEARLVRKGPRTKQDKTCNYRDESAGEVQSSEGAEWAPALSLQRKHAGPAQAPIPALRDEDLYASDFEDEEPFVLHRMHKPQLTRANTPEARRSARLENTELQEESMELQLALERSIKERGFQSGSGPKALGAACPTCGKTYVPQNSRFCRHCGQKRAAEHPTRGQSCSAAASAGQAPAQGRILEPLVAQPVTRSTQASLSTLSFSGADRATASPPMCSAAPADQAPVQSRLFQPCAAQPEASSMRGSVSSPSLSGSERMTMSRPLGSAESTGKTPLGEPATQPMAGLAQGSVSTGSSSRAAHTTAPLRPGGLTRITSIHSADVLGDADRLDRAALSRARVRRDEGTRGRMVGLDGEELSRSQGAAFSAGTRL